VFLGSLLELGIMIFTGKARTFPKELGSTKSSLIFNGKARRFSSEWGNIRGATKVV
jgi:hypothetical protein